MISRRTALSLLAGSAALVLPAAAFAGPPNTPPGQGGAAPGNSGNAPGKMKNHKNGASLVGEKIKENGNHGLGKAGKIDVSADVRGGKVVGFHAKDPDKGELAIKKVKSTQKLAVLEQRKTIGADGVERASVVTVWYYAYWFTDDFGNDWYYWFPVEYIVDDGGWTIIYA
jgi:hypothetical protein